MIIRIPSIKLGENAITKINFIKELSLCEVSYFLLSGGMSKKKSQAEAPATQPSLTVTLLKVMTDLKQLQSV